MDTTHIVTMMHPLLLFTLIVVYCVLAAEVGSLVARFRMKRGVKDPETPVGTAVGAMLGLLAFMLGFTFSVGSNRLVDRKQLSITQTNALGTSYLRTSALPEKQKQNIRKYYREYAAILATRMEKKPEIDKAVKRLEKLHILIWRETASLANEDIDSELRSLFTASVNNVIDIASERKTVALVFQIPSMFWNSLFLLAGLSMFSIGYQTGTFGSRRILDLPLLAAGFALVIVMIAGIDSTAAHGVKINRQPFIDLQKMMQEDIP